MNRIGPLNGLPIACNLTPSTGKEQDELWRAFDDDYLLDVERTETALTIHYVGGGGSVQRLRDLVEVERLCCSFVDWTIDDSHADLRLVISGRPEQIAALNAGNG